MPGASITDALKKAYATAPTDAVVYHTLELNHASFEAPIRLVQGFEGITATLEADAPHNGGEEVTFIPMFFEFDLPPVRAEEVPYMDVQIRDASRLVIQPLEDAQENPSAIQMIYRPYLSTDLSQPQMSPPLILDFEKITVSTSESLCAGHATFNDFRNRAFPFKNYAPAEYPGLRR